jgi:hypothetical protein
MKKILFVLMVGGILSCAGNHGNQYENKFDFAEFDSKRAAWEALGIDAYRFTGRSFSMTKGWMPHVTVTVLPGKEPELTYDAEKADGGDLLFISQGMPFRPFSGLTIDELFDSIREIASNYSQKDEYNQKYHYPESIYTGNSSLEITHFEVLQGGSGE